MRRFLLKIIVTACAVLVVAKLVPGIEVNSFIALAATAVVLSIFNAVLRPIMIVLTLPVTFVTLGLFIFIINGIILYLTSLLVEGFEISGFLVAIIAAILISLASSLINWLVKG